MALIKELSIMSQLNLTTQFYDKSGTPLIFHHRVSSQSLLEVMNFTVGSVTGRRQFFLTNSTQASSDTVFTCKLWMALENSSSPNSTQRIKWLENSSGTWCNTHSPASKQSNKNVFNSVLRWSMILLKPVERMCLGLGWIQLVDTGLGFDDFARSEVWFSFDWLL